MSKPLDYECSISNSITHRCRREPLIYAAGVMVFWALLVIIALNWPRNSNRTDPVKAQLNFAERTIGAVAIIWLVSGLIRICRSPMLRRSWLIWLCVLANLVVTSAVFLSGYQ